MLKIISNSPLVSVICPVYNAELYLEETIQSVLSQSYPHWELLLVMDTNSKDQSLVLAKKWSQKDPRIKVLESATNKGVAHNRNYGIQEAKGEFIAFLDADDLWLPKKLEKQILFMNTHSIDFSCHSYQQINISGERLSLIRRVPQRMNYSDLLKSNQIGCLTVMVRSTLLKKFSFKPQLPHEDFLLWLELLQQTPSYGIDEVLALYRVMPQSRSSNKKQAALDRWFIYRKILKLSLIKSIYYFAHYASTAVLQRINRARAHTPSSKADRLNHF